MLGGDDQHVGQRFRRPSASAPAASPDREWIRAPDFVDGIDPEMRVLEQVRSLAVDLERVVLIEEIEVEGLGHKTPLSYRRLRLGEVKSPD